MIQQQKQLAKRDGNKNLVNDAFKMKSLLKFCIRILILRFCAVAIQFVVSRLKLTNHRIGGLLLVFSSQF